MNVGIKSKLKSIPGWEYFTYDKNVNLPWLYVINMGGIYKIGVTKNPEIRMGGYRTHNPNDLIIEFAAKVPFAYELEKYIQIKYKAFNIRNEWFLLTEDHINEIVEYCGLWIEKKNPINNYLKLLT